MRTFDNGELQRRVDEVLFYVWDPIGVADEPCARSEYESYVPKVLQLVQDNDSIQPIAVYLDSVVTSRMGLSANRKHCEKVAELLLRHKDAINKGLA